MANCSFCDGPVSKGSGMIYVKKDGTIYNFCSSKCRKNNLDLKREGRRQKWTQAAKKFMAREATKAAGAKAAPQSGPKGQKTATAAPAHAAAKKA